VKKIPISGAAAGVVLAAVGALTSCSRDGGGPLGDGDDGVQAVAALPSLELGDYSDADEARGLWIAMADDPLHHVQLARDLVARGDREQAARQLDMSAYLFRWGGLYARGMGEHRDFVATAQELEDAARRLRRGEREDLAGLDRTLSRGLRVMGELHADEVMGEWTAGEHSRAALLLHASADEIRCGLSLSGVTPGGTIERALADAGSVADRLDSRSPPEEHEVRDAVEGLRDGASILADVLGSRSS
jgi:hypothetical protein